MKEGQLVVRPANLCDYDDISKLSERMKDTFDYVPDRFHKWLKEPNRITVVAEIATQVVAFAGFSVIDGEESVIMEAGRVDPSRRGEGIAGLPRCLGIELTRQKFPKLVRARYSVWSGVYQEVKNSLEKNKVCDKELHCYDFLTYNVEPKHVNFKYKLKNCLKLQPCTEKEFKNRIRENTDTSSLFPNNILVIDWQPFEAIPSNFEYIVHDRDRYFVDMSTDCQGKLLTSCSMGRFVRLVCGMVWNSTIYAKDSKLCQSHVIHQLMTACETAQEKFIFTIFQDPSLTECCKEVLENIPGVKCMNDDESRQRMSIFEGGLTG